MNETNQSARRPQDFLSRALNQINEDRRNRRGYYIPASDKHDASRRIWVGGVHGDVEREAI